MTQLLICAELALKALEDETVCDKETIIKLLRDAIKIQKMVQTNVELGIYPDPDRYKNWRHLTRDEIDDLIVRHFKKHKKRHRKFAYMIEGCITGKNT